MFSKGFFKMKDLPSNIVLGQVSNMAGGFIYSHLIKGELLSFGNFLVSAILTICFSVFIWKINYER